MGIILSGSLTLFLVFKVLAVAGWDPNTAMGIIAASGTANVLVGATVAFLPTLYALFFISALPRLQARLELKNRTSVERSAARLLETWPITLMMFIVPLYLVLGILLVLLLPVAVKLVGRRRKVSRTARPEDRVSRFEANAVAASSAILLLFVSLGTPWLPTEAVQPAGGESQTAYVLVQDADQIVVLLHQPRRIERWDRDGLTREVCKRRSHWLGRTVLQFSSSPGYDECPTDK